jgi:coenzyme F420-reducing hydrogenase alpha subunit
MPYFDQDFTIINKLDTKYRRAKTKLKDLKSHKNPKTLKISHQAQLITKSIILKKIIEILNSSDLNKNEFLIFTPSKLTQA